MDNLPIACSLDGPQLSSRQVEIRSGVLAEARAFERLPDGYRWHFADAVDLFGRLGAVIDAERRCCRFLRVEIIADPDLGDVALAVTGPAGTTGSLESWFPSPSPANL